MAAILGAKTEFFNTVIQNTTTYDYRFLDDFRAFMQVKAMKDTTISIILRTLRAIINKAIKEKILNQNDYPI